MGTAYSYLFCEDEEESIIDNHKWKSMTKHIDNTYHYTKYKNYSYYFETPTYKEILLLID
tara:strand:- start:69 stop:248 length:180 start_codon:yes stop_codon:yes gene_type:complete